MTKIYQLVVLCCIFTVPHLSGADLDPVNPSDAGLSESRLERIVSMMQADIESGDKSGIGILIARHGKIAFLHTEGYANLERKTPLTAENYFRMYSMTKPITSVALLTLYEQGHFQLTDPLEKYIPAYADVRVFTGVDNQGEMILEKPDRKITIQDVFRHTAGFSYGGFNDNTMVGKAYEDARIGYEEGESDSLEHLVVQQLPSMPLKFHPGTQWYYSFAHDVQAYLVEYFSGMAYEDYLDEAILMPLGMTDTFFGIPRNRQDRYTHAYTWDEDRKLELSGQATDDEYQRYEQHPFGGSGLSSTLGDYARFAQMLLNKGEMDGVRILGKKTVELMSSNHLGSGLTTSPGVGYGLGVSVGLDMAQKGNLGSAGEFGWAGYAGTWVTIDPEEDLMYLIYTQHIPLDFYAMNKYQTLIYQSLVD